MTPSSAAAEAPKRPRLTLGLVAGTHSSTHMFAALMPLVYPPVMAAFGISYAELGVLVGVGNAVMSLLQGLAGFLSRYVLRRVLLGLGVIALGISMCFMALTGGFVPFFLLNIVARASMSPQHPIGNSLVAENFGKKLRGTAFSINFAGANAGTLLVPSLGVLAIASLGWRWALVVFALVPVITGTLAITLIPERRKPRVAAEVAGPASAGGRKRRLTAPLRDFLAPLKDRNVFLVVLAAVVAAGGRGIGVVMTYVPLYLQQGLHLGAAETATLFTLLMVGSVVGPLVIGRLSDAFGRKGTLTVSYLLSLAAVLALLWAGGSLAGLAAAIGFLGVTAYSLNSQIQAYLADVAPEGTLDMAYGVFFTISYLAGAGWAVVLGRSIDSYGFRGAFLLMAASYLAGALVLIPAQKAD